MDRCYKFIVSLLVFISIIVPSNKVLAEGDDLEDKSVPAVKTNSNEERKAVIDKVYEKMNK